MTHWLIAILFVTAWPITVEAGWDRKAEEWNKWTPAQQQNYLMGVLDGFANIATVAENVVDDGSGDKNIGIARAYLTLQQCMHKNLITYDKAHALVTSYIIRHPDDGHYALASTIWSAIAESCPSPKTDDLTTDVKEVTIPPAPPEAITDYKNDPSCRRSNGRRCGTMP